LNPQTKSSRKSSISSDKAISDIIDRREKLGLEDDEDLKDVENRLQLRGLDQKNNAEAHDGSKSDNQNNDKNVNIYNFNIYVNQINYIRTPNSNGDA